MMKEEDELDKQRREKYNSSHVNDVSDKIPKTSE